MEIIGPGPTVMGYSCRRCGKTYRKRRSLTRMGYCPSGCGVDEAEAAARDMARREGRYYARWQAAMAERFGGSGATPPDASSSGS